jgi:hypothetical protein
MSKVEKVYDALKKAGDNGVHSFDLQPIGGWRYAARIRDLKKSGVPIRSEDHGKNGSIYYLGE